MRVKPFSNCRGRVAALRSDVGGHIEGVTYMRTTSSEGILPVRISPPLSSYSHIDLKVRLVFKINNKIGQEPPSCIYCWQAANLEPGRTESAPKACGVAHGGRWDGRSVDVLTVDTAVTGMSSKGGRAQSGWRDRTCVTHLYAYSTP